MQPAKQIREGRVGWHEWQCACKRQPDRRGDSRRCMADPARERDQHQREIEQPVHDICQECLGYSVRVQWCGVCLGRGVSDTRECHDENSNSKGFVQRKQQDLSGGFGVRAKRRVIGNKPERNDGKE